MLNYLVRRDKIVKENLPSSLKYYVKNKENEINNLIKTIEVLQKVIEQKEEMLLAKEMDLEHEKLNESLLIDKFNSLTRIVRERGIFLLFHIQNHKINEWDNLFIRMINNKNLIVDKNGEVIGELDKEIMRIFNKEIKTDRYSILVIRVNSKMVKARLVIK